MRFYHAHAMQQIALHAHEKIASSPQPLILESWKESRESNSQIQVLKI